MALKNKISKEYLNFQDIYNNAQNIIMENLNKTLNTNKFEKVKLIRAKCNKDTLNGFCYIALLPQYIANELKSKTLQIKLSMDSLLKNIIEHPEISTNEYAQIQYYLKNAEYIMLKNSKNLIYFKIENNIYQFVIKTTKDRHENFITTFHKANIKQLQKDIKRYKQIKR